MLGVGIASALAQNPRTKSLVVPRKLTKGEAVEAARSKKDCTAIHIRRLTRSRKTIETTMMAMLPADKGRTREDARCVEALTFSPFSTLPGACVALSVGALVGVLVAPCSVDSQVISDTQTQARSNNRRAALAFRLRSGLMREVESLLVCANLVDGWRRRLGARSRIQPHLGSLNKMNTASLAFEHDSLSLSAQVRPGLRCLCKIARQSSWYF